MATTLKVKLRTAALAFSGLTNLLGGPTSNLFRWYDTQLAVNQQGGGWPAVVVQIISNPNTYVVTGRLPTGWTRVQFTIYSTDPEVNQVVVTQLKAFLDQFSQGTGIPGQIAYPNQVVNERDGGIPQTQPLTYAWIVDAQVFNNDSI